MPQTQLKQASTKPVAPSVITSSTPSTSETSKLDALYFHRDLEAYECLGCHEFHERASDWRADQPWQSRSDHPTNPENRLIWLELISLDHERCHLFRFTTKRNLRTSARSRKSTIQRKPQVPVFRPA